jgi:hypothetical protein
MPDHVVSSAPANLVRLKLPDVTLCTVEGRETSLALAALGRSMEHVEFGDVILVAPCKPVELLPFMRFVKSSAIQSSAAYSHFVMTSVLPHVRTSHVLFIQWDGFIIDHCAWRDEFLDYDYIGAPWPQFRSEVAVGNGGFSLRSKRLLEALQDSDIVVSHPEDVAICHTNRALLEKRYSIRFAPAELAYRFAFERGVPQGTTFGFHGLFNFHRVLGAELPQVLKQIPDAWLGYRDSRDLCLALSAEPTNEARRLALALARRGLVSRPTKLANWGALVRVMFSRWCQIVSVSLALFGGGR